MAPIVVEQLIEAARKQTGLEHFDSDSYREGLEVLVADMNKLSYSESGAARNNASLVGYLAARLKTTDYLNQRPELLQRPIEKPIFVFGIPRTGTTLLSNLFACDPARRSPLTWEIDDPVPPATSATLRTDPRAIARLEQEKAMLAANPSMGKYYRNSAIYPNECVWLFSTDMTSAYEYHKRFLQLLQADAPGVWNLKMPSHALWLETLLKVYPDARLVWTHRDPFTAMGSFCSIISLGHMGFTGSVDKAWIAENCSYQAFEHANRIMDAREKLGENRIVDVHYADMTSDPIGTRRNLYKALGDDFTPQAEAAMQQWLDDNPQSKFGKHEYNLAQYGLSIDKLQDGFERYLSRYEVAREG